MSTIRRLPRSIFRIGTCLALAGALAIPTTVAHAAPAAPPTQLAAAAARPQPMSAIAATGGSWTPSGSTVTISWPKVAGATQYEVFTALDWHGITSVTTPTMTVTGTSAKLTRLSPGTEYTIRVFPVNDAGRGTVSGRIRHVTLKQGERWYAAAPPVTGQVTVVDAAWTKSGSSMKLDWADVARANSYDVFVNTDPDAVFTMLTPTKNVARSSAQITGLKPGVKYTVRVAARNNIGRGPSANRVPHITRTQADMRDPWYTSRPEATGLVTFVGASLERDGATLTIDWPNVKRATAYDVYASTSFEGVAKMSKPTMTVRDSSAKISKLRKGQDYFVRVVATNNAGRGVGSARVAHKTIAAETTAGKAKAYSLMTWNVCSNACSGIAKRKPIIDSRIRELAPGIVGLQEASKYTKAPAGYSFAVNGQNDILVRNGTFSKVTVKGKVQTSGSGKFRSRYSSAGQGVAWSALRHSSGQHVVVFNTHLVVGNSSARTRQRQYEADQLATYVNQTMSRLGKTYPALRNASPVILGDLNVSKGREGDATASVLLRRGWSDAFDQARALSGQHHNSANPTMSTKPVIAVTWGAHVDKVLVKPSRTIITSWANAGKMKNGRYVAPLGSDHHPILVKGIFR
ncbi:fibronectin type III domain-containing protein [Microbacterium sp. 77mftsu3.1]|uniref:fibronectin type III domain-containing protein n=1 Tax=Microbacterium sp. 77mftsu3.1 TaxID=1761802 RepID=UPI00039AFC54|nr:fibronectin type III domain-containing protein [Microbacterium sp. 77mftsu3.1]SDH34024.1 Fibronectin type III domain-containing protein [Microbacterium sp. 77mftsu3.1]